MTTPIRPTRQPRRKSLAELNAEIDALLNGVELDDPAPAASPPRRSLLDGLTMPKSRTFEAASTGVRDNFQESQARELESEIAKRPMYSGSLGRTPEERRRNLPEYAARKNEAALSNPAIDAGVAFTRTAGGSTTQLAAGGARLLGQGKAADELAALSRDMGAYQPRTGAGRGAAFLGYGAPFMAAGAFTPGLIADAAVGAGMSALQAIGDPEQSTARAFSELTKDSKTFGRFSKPLREISENKFLNPLFEGGFDVLATLTGRGAMKAGGVGLDAARRTMQTLGDSRGTRSSIAAPTLDATRPAYRLGGDGGMQPDVAEPDLDAWRETTFGSATFDDPMRAAQDELDTQRAGYDAAQARARQRRQEMAARGREAGARRAQQAEDAAAEADLNAAMNTIPPLPRTVPTSAEVDAAARSQEAWARREYGQREKLNTAVDTGSDDDIITELDKMIRDRGATNTVDLTARLEPRNVTPQLDEVGQQLDEAGREALDAQNAPEVVNPNVRAAKDRLNTALDSGDNRKVQRALRELAKLQDQGLYAAAPVGLAMSQDNEGEGMEGSQAALLASLGLIVAGKKGTFGGRLYSRLGRAIDNAPFEKGTADQWMAALSKNVAKGEREHTGVDALLQQAKTEGRTLTRSEIRRQLEQNAVKLNETVLGGGDVRPDTVRVVRDIAEQLRAEFDDKLELADLDENALDEVVSRFEDALPRKILGELGQGTRRELARLDSNNAEWGVAVVLRHLRDLEDGVESKLNVAPSPKYPGHVVASNPRISEPQNYQESLIRLDGPDAGFQLGHWREHPNTMPHVRTSERIVEGQRSLFVDEIQDDWAQRMRKGGVLTEETRARQIEIEGERDAITEQMDGLRAEAKRILREALPQQFNLSYPPGAFDRMKLDRVANTMLIDAANTGTFSGGPTDAIEREYARLQSRLSEVFAEQGKLADAVPDRPFKQTSEWAELGIKKALDEAVQKGHTQVVIATGEQISKAVGAEIPEKVEAIDWSPDFGRDYGSLTGWRSGEDVKDVRMTEAEMRKLVGDEMADRLIAAGPGEPLDWEGTLGKGGNVAFYGEVLPRVIKDYEKKLGVKIPTRRTADGNLVIDMTPELRSKIETEGQPLWAAGAAGAGVAAGDDDGEHDSFLQAAAAVALVAGGAKWAQRYARPEQATKRAVQWVRKNAKSGVPEVQRLAKSYMQQAGVQAQDLPRVRQVDPMFGKRVAEWYESAQSDPTNPEVVAAYRAFAEETRQQYDYLRSQGITFEFVDENPYNSSAEMLRDVAQNKRLRVYKTADDQSHPLLSNEENDMFRAVHDFFGHAKEAHQFGPKGEENAYRVHSAMYSPEARRVMATETRGQNSWVNFHEKAAANRAKPGSVYAEQKVALMPDELMGDYPDSAPVDAITNVEFKSESQRGFTNAEFKEMTNIERKLGRAAFIAKVVEPIIRSENLPASVAKGLGSWFTEGDYAITEAARIELSKLPKYVIERALARVSSAAKQAGYFFAVPNPNGERVAVTLDFGKSLSENEYKQVVEALSREDNGATFEGTTMVRLTPGRMQTVLNEGTDESAATALIERARALFPNLNITGDAGRVDAILRGGDTLDEALAQYADRIGVLGPGERRVQQEAARNYERIAGGARSVRAALGQVDAFLEGVRTGGERGLAQMARGASGAARPLTIGAALALTPSEAEGQGLEGVSGLAGEYGLTALGVAGLAYGGKRMLGRRGRNAIGRVASGAERMTAEADPLTNARPGNFTPNLQRVQRAAYAKPLQSPSQVVHDQWFRMDKASPDADKGRLAQAVEEMVATSGVAVQKADRMGNPVAGKPTITWDQVRDEARKLQIDPDRLIEAARQRGWTPAEALAGRTVIGDNVNVIAALEKELQNNQLPIEEKKRLQGVLEQYEDQTNRLLEVYTTERSAAGRLLNSYKIVANQTLDPTVWASRAFKANRGNLNMQQLAALNGFIAAQDRAGLAKFVADLHKPTYGELFGSFVKAGLLMSPKTHMTNLASNALMTTMEMAKDAPAALADRALRALVDYVDPTKTGARRTKDFNPAAMLSASAKGAKQGIEEARKILRGEAVNNPLARWDANGEAFVRTGNPTADKIANNYLNLPFRALSAGDRVFRQAAMERSIAEQQRVLRTQAVTDDMMLTAIADAEFATFQQRTALGEMAQSAKRGFIRGASESGAAAEFAATALAETTLPFTKTPAAVLSSSVEYAAGMLATPVDLARLIAEAKKGIADPNQRALVEALQKRASERLGRQAVGVLAILAGWTLAANGALSAPIPLQKKSERDTQQMFGNSPGGSLDLGETTMSVDRISPLGNLFTAGAAMAQTMRDPENSALDAFGESVFSMGSAMFDNSFLQGVQDLQRATTDEGGAQKLVERRALAAVPFNSLLRSVSRMTDPVVRDPQATEERLMAGLPYFSRKVAARRDPLGNEVRRAGGALGEFVPGTLGVDRSETDPRAKMLRDLNAVLTRPTRDKNKESVEEFRQREPLLGEATRKEIDRLQRLPNWNMKSRDEKRERVESRITTVRSQATRRFRSGLEEAMRPNVARGGGAGSAF